MLYQLQHTHRWQVGHFLWAIPVLRGCGGCGSLKMGQLHYRVADGSFCLFVLCVASLKDLFFFKLNFLTIKININFNNNNNNKIVQMWHFVCKQHVVLLKTWRTQMTAKMTKMTKMMKRTIRRMMMMMMIMMLMMIAMTTRVQALMRTLAGSPRSCSTATATACTALPKGARAQSCFAPTSYTYMYIEIL